MEPQQEPSAPRELGREAGASAADHQAVRLWLRLLSCSTQIEQSIRALLRSQFATSLPRFDYMAQLYRQPEGLKMSELSRFLMVTGGNVTGVTDELVREGMVTRTNSASDRRSWIVSLTAQGHATFKAMAQEHEQWILEFFSGMDASTVQTLYNHLGRLRVQLVRQQEPQTKDRP